MRDRLDARTTLYLPVEIKAREFTSKILLALFAAHKGFRVYLGSKYAVDQCVRASVRKKAGVYFYKSGNLRGRFEGINSKCDSLVVLDEEMGVAVKDIEFYYRQRVSSPECISRYFVISDKHRRVASEVNPQLSEAIRVTGWPRADFWRTELSGFYAAEVRDLKNKYQDFILFSSDFGFIDERRISDEISRLRVAGTESSAVALLEKKWRAAQSSYREFVDFLKDFDKVDSPYKIIVRPHPAENHAQWHADIGKLKNVSVIYQGEIGPWLLASEALLHRGCTTAVQAYVSKKPSFYWCLDSAGEARTDMLPYKLSTVVTSSAQFYQVLDELTREPYLPPVCPDDLQDELHLGERLAADLIVDELLSLNVSPEYRFLPSSIFRSFNMALGAARDYRLKLGVTRSKVLRDQYLRKLPGGITAAEVEGVIAKLPFNFPVKIRQVLHNLVEIERE